MSEFNWREVLTSPLFAGFLGVIVAVLKFMPGTSYAEKSVNFVSGSALVWSCGPGAIEFFSIQSAGMASLMSFAVGAFGLSAAAAFLSGIKETKFGEIITGWLSFGRKD